MAKQKDNSGIDESVLRAHGEWWRSEFFDGPASILDRLRDAILRRLLPPGTRLRQEDLAEVFQTSRIPIREALRVLEYEGLVSSTPRRGFTVTALDSDDLDEIYDLLITLETRALQLAIPLLTEADRADLRDLSAAMESEEDLELKRAKREQFYLRLFTVTARPRLLTLISRLRREVVRAPRRVLIESSPERHAIFLDAVMIGDVDAAIGEHVPHLQQVRALMLRFFREAKDGRGDPTAHVTARRDASQVAASPAADLGPVSRAQVELATDQ